MRIQRQLIVLALISAISLAAFAAAQSQGKDAKGKRVTVGDFAVMLASNAKGGERLEVNSAAEKLLKTGVPLGSDLNAPLSERKLAEILGYYGLQAKTSSPDQAVSRAKAEAAVALVSTSSDKLRLASGPDSATVPPPALECIKPDISRNHGSCVNCCKDLGGSANACSQLCMAINKPSADEPLP
jgi:hypothetical protein